MKKGSTSQHWRCIKISLPQMPGPLFLQSGFSDAVFHYMRGFYRDFQSPTKGGGKTAGGGQNLTRRPPTENSFRPPSPRYVPSPPPCHFSYEAPYKLPEFPSGDPLKSSFRRVSKMISKGHPCEVLPPPLLPPPPFGSAQDFVVNSAVDFSVDFLSFV